MGKIVCIVQARLDSKRLPGKSLMDIGGHPLIWHVLNRASKIDGISDIILTVPVGQSGDFSKILGDLDPLIFEGPHPDLLTSYYEAAVSCKADVIIRITGDCWSICPEISERVLGKYLMEKGKHQYFSNTNPETQWPDGLDTEVFSMGTLAWAYSKADDYYDRHHVTPWIKMSMFESFLNCPYGNYSKWKLSIDVEKDLKLARYLYDRLPGINWTWKDLESLLIT